MECTQIEPSLESSVGKLPFLLINKSVNVVSKRAKQGQ